ncbi:MAG: MBL fold metallo-hydrolase [Candidatus Eremiobacteraeota bacterium]|nr:MBL fold metallo-hydrolase [Candidatus Eremiobacteraeota bacterium]
MGSSSSTPRPGRACSSYVVASERGAVALDFGSGALAALRTAWDYAALDALLISHMHADHFLDLVPLRYALKYGPQRRERPLDLYLPPGGEAMLQRMVCAFTAEGRGGFFDGTLAVRTYDPQKVVDVGGLSISFAPTVHSIKTYAMRVESDGFAVAYSADTAPCEAVVALASRADAFICECTLGAAGSDARPRMHSTAREAGEMAARAEARHLVLSHYGSECDPAAMLQAARSAYDGTITLADDGLEIALAR